MKLWLTLLIGGQAWRIYLVGPRSRKLRDGKSILSGKAEYATNKIYISRNAPDGVREDTLLHELLHVALHVSGADKVYDEDTELDERLVTAVTPTLHRLLLDLGFAFPTPPSR
jgi:hypothetical protein